MHQGHAKVQSSLHTTRIGFRRTAGTLDQSNLFENFIATRFQTRSTQPVQFSKKHQVIDGAEFLINRVFLGNNS